jgi:DNA-binding response OmpR family regulator
MKKLLVITNDDELLNFFIQNWHSEHFMVAQKHDLFQGLKYLSRKNVDILLYDADSPGLDAVQGILVAKKLNISLHIIVATSENHWLRDPSLDKRKIDFLLFKPLNFSNLKSHLNLLVNDENPVHPTMSD